MKYIDIHSHVYFPDYDSDREEVISRAAAADVGIITVGTDLDSSRKAVKLAETHKNMWAIIGLHPVDVGEEGAGDNHHTAFPYDSFKELALNPKVVAIGECGLDYFHTPTNADRQRQVFIEHIKLANEVGKPLMLHVRNGKDNLAAYQEALVILKEHSKVSANFHFFAGTKGDLKNIVYMGYSVSFTGVITFAKEYAELVKMAPLDKIMSETDAPFVSPIPYRGKRNEPVHVIEVAHKIAEIRGKDGEESSITLAALVDNAKKFFNI